MADEIFTPKWLFDALNVNFDLDPASSHHPLVCVPANKRFTKAENGLLNQWWGNVWLNPPYSEPKPWVMKWLEHKQGMCLTPIGSNGKWVNELWNSEASCLMLQPNLPFQGSDGKIAKMRWRVALWAIGETNVTALEMSGLGKIR